MANDLTLIGQALKDRRESLGYTLRQMSESTGYCESSIRNMELGKDRVLFRRYVWYAHHLGCRFAFEMRDA